MSDKQFRRIGLPEDRLIEECSEVIKAICKAKRFGWEKRHPNYHDGKVNNLQAVRDEIVDVQQAIADFESAYGKDNEKEG